MKKKAETDPNSEYKCEHCNRVFARPNTMLKHVCEPKRRWDERERPANRIAFSAWLKFYQQLQPSKKRKEYTDFIKSAYYGGFVKYGIYCVDVGVINPLAYVDSLLKDKVALDNWNSDKQYTQYLIKYLRSENVYDAVKRSIETMLTISEQENVQLGDIFRYVNSNKICHKIINGKISPWLLYQSKTGIEFLTNINDDQRGLIFEYIDPERWQIKFLRDPEAIAVAKAVIDGVPGL